MPAVVIRGHDYGFAHHYKQQLGGDYMINSYNSYMPTRIEVWKQAARPSAPAAVG
jgi:hypothetical protein